jgi:hypothetical protein
MLGTNMYKNGPMSHVRLKQVPVPQSCINWDQTNLDCLQLYSRLQHVQEWPKWKMFGLKHVSVDQSYILWAKEAPRLPPAACKTPTSARMAVMTWWPSACPVYQSCKNWFHPGCRQLHVRHQQVLEWPTNESCLAFSISQCFSHVWTGIRQNPGCLQLHDRYQKELK